MQQGSYVLPYTRTLTKVGNSQSFLAEETEVTVTKDLSIPSDAKTGSRAEFCFPGTVRGGGKSGLESSGCFGGVEKWAEMKESLRDEDGQLSW